MRHLKRVAAAVIIVIVAVLSQCKAYSTLNVAEDALKLYKNYSRKLQLNKMVAIEIPSDYGFVVLVAVAFWIQQSIIFVVPIGLQRSKTGIKPPVIYPSDSLVKSLNLTDSQVNQYMCAQRVHQNNMEFLVAFFPMLLIAGLHNPLHTAAAGAVVWLGRLITALGYWSAAEKRMYGAWYHIPEFYIIYLAVRFGIELIQS